VSIGATSGLRALLLAAVLAMGAPGGAAAQVFLAERPHQEFMVGPLFVRASVDPALGDIPVDLLFSLFVPPTVTPGDLEQDLFLVWPGAIQSLPDAGPLDPKLARQVEGLGLTMIGHGRTELLTRSLFQITSDGDFTTGAAPEPIPGGATFITIVRENGTLGLSAPATLVRIPWTQRLVNRAWLMNLRLVTRGMLKPKPATWVERTLWGQRYRLAMSFHDVRQRAVFPIYFWNRERVVRLSDDPSQLIVNFAMASRLKIDEMYPQSAQRRLSESQEDTDVVSLFLDRGEGLTPQAVAVQFGYFSGLQSWAPVLIPIIFFTLGNLAGPLIRVLATWGGRALSARVAFGRTGRGLPMESGVVAARETVARIVPGETRYAEVLRILGPQPEEHEQLGAPDRKTLIYRGRRIVPHRRRRLLWFSTVAGWDVEHHEVEIAVDREVVADVQARVRRTHPASPIE
jgi:hypothetical protein